MHYKKHLLLQLVTSIDAGKEFEHNLLDALYLLRLSWNNVKSSTQCDCFKHCGFTTQEDSPDQQSPVDETENSDGEEARLLFSQVNCNVSIDDYLNVDDQVLTSQMLSDEEIVASVRSSAEEQSSSISPPTEEEDVDELPPVVSDKDAQEDLLTL